MAVKQGVVQTELGVLPEDWKIVPIGEAGQVLGGRQRSPHAVGELQKYLRVANVFDGHIDTQDVLEMPFSSSESLRFRLEYGDILLNEGQSLELVGRSAIYRGDPPECCFQNTLVRFRVNPGTLPEFAQMVFQNYLRTGVFASIALQTTSIAHLGAGRLATLKMPLPDKHEQQAIAEVIGDADALIESLEKLLAKKRQIKQGAMQELLTGKKRLPGFMGKWERKRLGLLATIQRGASPRPIENPIWFDDNSSVGWVRISDVTSSGMYLTATTQRLSPLGIQKSRPVSRGSLIMSICATVGRPTITDIDVCIHDGFVVFENLRIDKSFLYYVLRSIETSWSQSGQTGSQMNLNTGLITRTEVLLPPNTDEQAAIAAVLHDVDAEITAVEIKIAKARQVKQGMMQKLLTGRIRLIQPSAEVVPLPVKQGASAGTKANHNPQINEAVVLAVLAHRFGSEQFPLGRFRRTKLSYLLHRHSERQATGFMKKAAGPYNPQTRYGGAEKIALNNGYVRIHKAAKSEGFIAADNIAQAEGYFESWYGLQVLDWLKQFRYKKNEELELLTTVDMAIEDLRREGKSVTVSAVRQIIHDSPEWKAKLDRATFADNNITAATESCRQLFPVEE